MISANASRARKMTRWLSPAGLILTGLFLLMPLVAVSCDAPGGYGRAAAGGTTKYTGYDLVTGDEPQVSPPDRVLRAQEQRDDTLGVQPLAVAVVLLIVAGVVVAIVVDSPVRRRLTLAVVGAVAAVFLVAGQVTVRSLLESRLREQLASPLPAGKEAIDYVHTQPGFWLALGALLVLSVANGVGVLRLRRAGQGGAGPHSGSSGIGPG